MSTYHGLAMGPIISPGYIIFIKKNENTKQNCEKRKTWGEETYSEPHGKAAKT